jgi:hypothetical protein
MNSRFKCCFYALILGLAVSCSKRPELATTASLAQFDGSWTGEWSWKKGSVTDLDIKLGTIRFRNFPVSSVVTGEVAVSGESKAEFKLQWSTPAPCILVTLSTYSNLTLAVTVYMAEDKEHLYYPVSTSKRTYIVFSRKSMEAHEIEQ